MGSMLNYLSTKFKYINHALCLPKDSSSNKNFMIVKQDIDARRKRMEKGKCLVEWSIYNILDSIILSCIEPPSASCKEENFTDITRRIGVVLAEKDIKQDVRNIKKG